MLRLGCRARCAAGERPFVLRPVACPDVASAARHARGTFVDGRGDVHAALRSGARPTASTSPTSRAVRLKSEEAARPGVGGRRCRVGVARGTSGAARRTRRCSGPHGSRSALRAERRILRAATGVACAAAKRQYVLCRAAGWKAAPRSRSVLGRRRLDVGGDVSVSGSPRRSPARRRRHRRGVALRGALFAARHRTSRCSGPPRASLLGRSSASTFASFGVAVARPLNSIRSAARRLSRRRVGRQARTGHFCRRSR